MKRLLVGCALVVSTLSFGMMGVAHADSPSNGQSTCSHWTSSSSAPTANSRQPDGYVDFFNVDATAQTPGEVASLLASYRVHGEYANGVVGAICQP
jgi:hypothetical protein